MAVDASPDKRPPLTEEEAAAHRATVRKRVLPPLIRDEYRTARALAAQKDPDAEPRLTQVQQMLEEAEKVGAWDDTLADLRVLVDGFLDLSRAAGPFTSPAAVPRSAAAARSVPRARPILVTLTAASTFDATSVGQAVIEDDPVAGELAALWQ